MIETFAGITPRIHEDAFVHSQSVVIGNVQIDANASIWPCAVLRGDMGTIHIGEATSIQDGSVCHVTEGISNTLIGKRVTVGHRVVLHGCIVEDDCLIGMGAILLDNCVIGTGSLVAAGSLVTVGTKIPPNSLVMGSPAKVIRPIAPRERSMINHGWPVYVELAKKYA
jgi:carbonic anhydrase/acetyltransferase-like protein (isoleucine patch superfamily)